MEENLSQPNYFSNNKKFLLFVFVLLAIGLGTYLALFVFAPKSYRFTGNINSVTGNSIFVKGSFIVDNKPSGGVKNVEVLVTPETKFDATVLYEPTAAELAKTNGKWDMSTIRKETIAGSITDLNGLGAPISVKTNNNIFGQSKFNAETLSYSMIKYQEINSQSEPGACDDANGKYIGAEACMKKFPPPIQTK